jgi:nitrate reductase / nitrite oxidoreductase, beta subunit
MKIKAQTAMVLNLDKCIGCHTCSIPCKNVWTNRQGAEYMWFNNVETKPGIGYPKKWEEPGCPPGRMALKEGRLALKAGGRAHKGSISSTTRFAGHRRLLRTVDYDYEKLTDSPAGDTSPRCDPGR